MEFLKTIRRRSFLSEFVYIILNIVFAIAVLVVVRATDSPLLAFVLVGLSKWRVLAVRPRYWLANIQANLVDFIVSISLVTFLYSVDATAQTGLLFQLAITALHIVWLIFVKPLSSKRGVVGQAACALFAGVTALYVVSYAWPVSVVVLGMWLIGYVTARHVITLYKDDHALFLSLLWALVLAQVGWVAYHWTIAYTVPFVDVARVPQVSILVTCLGLLAYKAYDSYTKHETIRMNDIILPLLFSVSVVGVLLIFFNEVNTGIL